MRILYHHRTLADGAEGIHIREMIKAFRKLGHEVRVVALVGEGSSAKRGPAKAASRWSRISGWLPRGVYELAELSYNVVGGRAVSRAIREFQPDLVYDRYNSYSTAAVAAAKRAGVPVFLEVNAPVAFERANFDGPSLRWPRMAQRYERHICDQATHIFVVSTPLRDFLVQERGVPADKITVLPNGADPDAFDPHMDSAAIRQRYQLGARKVIGFVGILRPWHGVELLLDAFSRLSPRQRDLHLLLVGDGPSEQELKNQVARLGLEDRVTFTGRVSHGEIREHIAAMDMTVSPRATFYASPMKILEYMAMAVPVVAPRMPNIIDICDDGSDSLLFDPEDVASLQQCLERLIGDEQEARRLGAAARRKIEQHLNWQRNAEQIVAKAQDTLLQQIPA
jgi:glycosyltransferase involved in cell wall biosynthesis